MPEKKAMSVKAIIGRMFLFSMVAAFLALVLIKPNWHAHFVAVLVLLLSGLIILFFYGFHPKSDFIGRKTKFTRASERTQRNAQRVFRVIVIGFAFFILYFVCKPTLTDWIHFVHEGRPYLLEFKGIVRKNNNSFIPPYFLQQNLYVIKDGDTSEFSYTAMLFPRFAREGQTYWFIVAPKSGLVLDWQLADESTNAPMWK
jgi:hypothetical protein